VFDSLDARTGHIEQHLSTAFEQITRFASKLPFQEIQRTLTILIEQDSDQLDELLFVQYQLDRFLHCHPP
jgi:hypothetical protein